MSDWTKAATVALWTRLSERVPFLRVDFVRPADPDLPDTCLLLENYPPPMDGLPLGQVLVWYRENRSCVVRDYLLLPDGDSIPGDDREAFQLGFKSEWANRLAQAITDYEPIGEEQSVWAALRDQAEVQWASIKETTEELAATQPPAVVEYLRAYADELNDWVQWLSGPRQAFDPSQFGFWSQIRSA